MKKSSQMNSAVKSLMDPVHPGGVLDLLHRVEAAGGASAGNVLKGGGEQRQELFGLVRLRKESSFSIIRRALVVAQR